jgi:hypothetical protein
MFTIIRTDGTEEVINEQPTHHAIREAIHCDTLDVVQIGRANGTDEIMFVDDNSVAADKPVNEKATELYHRICKPGTTWQIRGDVAVTRDRYFGRG